MAELLRPKLLASFMATNLLVACGGPTSAEPESDNVAKITTTDKLGPGAEQDVGKRVMESEITEVAIEPGATVTYGGDTYSMVIQMCSASRSGDGSFNVWAITPDDEGTPTDGPRLHVHGQTGSSSVRFFISGAAAQVESTFVEDAALTFDNATLAYNGPATDNSTDTIQFEVRCRLPN